MLTASRSRVVGSPSLIGQATAAGRVRACFAITGSADPWRASADWWLGWFAIATQ